MKIAKTLLLAMIFLLLSTPVFAEGYMSIKLDANVQFIYVQEISFPGGIIDVPRDVTREVEYEVQQTAHEKTLVID